jgi:folate-binding protein YgfZ
MPCDQQARQAAGDSWSHCKCGGFQHLPDWRVLNGQALYYFVNRLVDAPEDNMDPAVAQPAITDFEAHLRERGAVLSGIQVQYFADRDAELAALPRISTVHPLLSDGLLRVSGADAGTFLQGQLTNDVGELDGDRAQLSAYCTPQGRMLASLLAWHDDGGYLLQLPRELCDGIRMRLQRYVLRARVKIVDETTSKILIGLGGPGAGNLLAEVFGAAPPAPMAKFASSDATIIGLGPDLFELVVDAPLAISLWDRLAQHARPAGTPAWQWRLIGAPIPVITAATQEQFVPQMANLEQLGAVNFTKGCYPGQEIVARSQYRGEVKRRLFRFHVDAQAAAAGQSIYPADAATQTVGIVVNAAPAPGGGCDMLAVVRIDQAQTGGLRLGTAGGTALERLPLRLGDAA